MKLGKTSFSGVSSIGSYNSVIYYQLKVMVSLDRFLEHDITYKRVGFIHVNYIVVK